LDPFLNILSIILLIFILILNPKNFLPFGLSPQGIFLVSGLILMPVITL